MHENQILLNKKYARLLLYNYCESLTTHVIKQMKDNDKTKQVKRLYKSPFIFQNISVINAILVHLM